jgi:hypothetical protein
MNALQLSGGRRLTVGGSLAICLLVAAAASAQYRAPCACASPGDCTRPGDAITAPTQRVPSEAQPQGQETPPALAEEQFASLGGDTISLAQSDSLGMSPNSIGDFFAGGCISAAFILPQRDFSTVDPLVVCIPTPGSSIGRIKIADNNNPLPRDRIFFDYNFFHNTNLNGIDVNRYTPGVEKTFLDGAASFEFRIPMAGTLDSNVVINETSGAVQSDLNGELGDLFFGFKALLVASDRAAISAGIGFTAPTANDVRVNLDDGTSLALIENEAVYVSPFAALLVTPTPNTFFQGYLQFNFDATGNPALVNTLGTGLLPVGRLNEQSSMFVDLSFGSWIVRDFSRGPRGLAWMIEAHYSTTIQDADSISGQFFQVGDPQFDFDVLNLTLGAHALFGQTVFTVGYGVPVTDERAFDGEIRAFVNRYF